MLRNEDVFLSHTWATIMAALCSFLVLVIVSIGDVLSSAITNDTTFYWQQLSTYPSISATIEILCTIQYQSLGNFSPGLLHVCGRRFGVQNMSVQTEDTDNWETAIYIDS